MPSNQIGGTILLSPSLNRERRFERLDQNAPARHGMDGSAAGSADEGLKA
jgi:hypothetical protein